MLFAPDTEVALRSVVNLINSAANGDEHLATTEDLDRFLEAEGFSGSRTRDAAELASVQRLRGEGRGEGRGDDARAGTGATDHRGDRLARRHGRRESLRQ